MEEVKPLPFIITYIMNIKKYLNIIVPLILWCNIQAQDIRIEKVKEFKLPDGYDCTLLEVVREEIVITCPDTRAFFYSVNNEDLKEIRYQLGRGPGELNRAPFGIAILSNQIVFSDPDLQRLFIYDKVDQLFSVETIKIDGGFTYLHSTENDSDIFIRNGLLGSLGNLYNISSRVLSKDFVLDNPFGNIFLKDGIIEVYGDLLLFGSMHEGYISFWDLKTHQQIKKYQLYENKDTKERQAKMSGLSGYIPPNSENQIKGVGLYQNEKQQLILVLIKSKINKFSLDKLYVYDTSSEKFVSEIKLEAEADMFETSGEFLYVHYEDLDKLVKYKLTIK